MEAAPRDDEPARRNDDDDDEHRRGSVEGEARPRATLPLRCRRRRWRRWPAHGHDGRGCRRNSGEAEGETDAGDGVPAKPRVGRGGGRRGDAEGGDGAAGPHLSGAAGAAGGSTVAATPLFCRRGRVSGDFPAKRRSDRGRGGSCEAEGGDGATGRRSGEEGEAAGGRPAPEREKEKAGRGGAATGELGKGLKQENARRGFHFIGEGREPGMGEGGTATGNTAGGHGRRPGMARPFRAIGGAIQGGKRGKSKRNQWGLITPI
uniref:Retrotransposon protein, putative, unclassified n=2 Tax=Oryza sativa subsp. japonica TaxID=39947 RepID=Q94LD2_ORYSJ|nr:hypothetical protein [Oryza sativa Japonica Group]ABF97158.1 retrotransposon protein, putative, unclassified [Oryza sativa Japonica Group]